MAGPPARKKAAPKTKARGPKPPARSGDRPAKRKPTPGERAAARKERHRRRRAHRAGLRAIRREQWHRLREFVVPPHTRDIGRAKATLVLILNIAPFPGLGTALYGQVERGVLQFILTFLFLVGWIWAIADGIRIAAAAYRPPPRPPHRLPPSGPRSERQR